MNNKSAIILCSGGLDSVITANYAKNKLGYDRISILLFNYGQKSLVNERKFSKNCARNIKAEFKEIDIKDLGEMSTSLINKEGSARKMSKKDLKDTKRENEKWYVPCRNLVFLSYALAYAESLYIKDKIKSEIFVGFKCEGKESYPDTTKKFIDKLNDVAKIGCSYPIKIKAPLIKMDKEDIVILGERLGVDFRKTFSCYLGKNKHCGECLSCQLRKAGFYWSGIADTSSYLT